jgi:hypothetical protein
MDSKSQHLESEADAYAHMTPRPQLPSKTKTYLKVTELTVASSGQFPRHPPQTWIDIEY